MRSKLIVFSILLLAGFGGCSNSVSEIGSELFANNSLSIESIDSVTLKVSTVFTDSMITSNTVRLLVGHHEDEKLGVITATSIFQLGIAGPIALDRMTTDYVSLRMRVIRDKYSYYDTTQTQTISVHQLSKKLKLNLNGNLYNTSKFSVDSSVPPLGTITFLPRPKTGDTLDIPLSDELGQQLMDMAHTNDPRLASNEEFLKFFKGIALIADSTTSRSVLGFTTRPEIRLYYVDRSTTPASNKYATFILGTGVFYNHIQGNRDGTALSSLKNSNQSVSSNNSGHEAYFQAGAGLAMRIEMPYLRDLLWNNRNFTVSRAYLELMPIKGSSITDALPEPIYMYRVDGQNRIITTTPLGARLIKDLELGRDTHWQADITAFVNSQIQTDVFNENALLVLLDDTQYRGSVTRIYVGDKKNQYSMKIKLFYIALANQVN